MYLMQWRKLHRKLSLKLFEPKAFRCEEAKVMNHVSPHSNKGSTQSKRINHWDCSSATFCQWSEDLHNMML
eukprot:1049016-Amphidinium_carterae.1